MSVRRAARAKAWEADPRLDCLQLGLHKGCTGEVREEGGARSAGPGRLGREWGYNETTSTAGCGD